MEFDIFDIIIGFFVRFFCKRSLKFHFSGVIFDNF